ncbi:MAG TPA: aminotransferase class III-fold pyridoxal phosphate-dependent enzyme, partial [Firmicutes bacterium]|nr:aminotransferase class III-fold pyridoxal phosphate-dependent enzyme [Bacillota bacterium]
GSHGCTFGGNPLIAKISLSVLEFISRKEFLSEVNIKGEYLKMKLTEKLKGIPFVKGIGGMGLMVGIYIDEFKPREIAEKILDRGVIVGTSGEDTIRLLPPLIINKGEIDKGVKIISSVLKELS